MTRAPSDVLPRAGRRALVRAVGSLALCAAAACGSPYGAPVRVVIPSGSSFRTATDSLAHASIIKSPSLFRLYAKLRGRDRDLKAGTYLLRRGTSWSEALDALTEGRGIVHSVTIPEGFSLSSIVPVLARALGTPVDSVEAAVRDTALLHRLDVPTATLEGYLFPDTYAFPDGTSARQAVDEMVRGFERRWKPEWDARLGELAMSKNDIVALASIIEKEARVPEERPVISAVYHNRLKARMPLQADPTVQYALGKHVDRVLYKDLDVVSAYNTYRHPGLPPGPIASPGLPSIVAALYPASVPYLYFVAAPDGHHEFRTSYADHQAAIREIRGAAAKATSSGGGAPRGTNGARTAKRR
ncbi:MAG TPA: endolytic transglycosylase MltG [Gemmatimonadaceae bacterium]|nr:endolytic transglycosylase MltG [Gemmatimonadaceae bacterium]